MGSEITLGDVARINNSARVPLSKAERSLRRGPFPYYGATGVLDHVDGYLFEGLHVLVGEDGTVIDAKGRPVTQLVDGRFWVSNHAHVVRGADDSDTRFLYYALANVAVRPFVTGSAQPKLSLGNLRAIPVDWPERPRREQIVEVVGALDDKIESNRRMVRLLESLGRAELASALSGPNGEPWESAWTEVPLGEVLSLIETGDRPKGGVGQIEGGIPSVGAESIIAPGVFDFFKTKFIPKEYFDGMRRGVLESGDVLLYKDGGTPGNFIPKVSMCQDGFPFEVAAINSHVYRLRVAAPYSQAFLYFWLSSQRMLDEMWLRGTGAAIPSLNSTNVKGLPFPVPPAEQLKSVLPAVDQIMSRLHGAALEQRTLEQLRDALLPALLSGRLRVRDADQVVSGAV